MTHAVVYRADFVAPLIGIVPNPKFPTGISYGKWVAFKCSDTWYIELGEMREMHWALEGELQRRVGNKGISEKINGTIEQRGGPGTHPTITSHHAKLPFEVEVAIRLNLLQAQARLGT